MKTTKIALTLAATALLAGLFAFGGEIADSLIAKVAAIKAKEFLSPSFIARFIGDGSHRLNDGGKIDFRDIYYRARDTSYTATFGDDLPFRQYVVLRTIMVSSFKKQLHADNGMEGVYDQCRDQFKADMKRQTPEFRKAAMALVETSIDTFTLIKDPAYRKGFQELIAVDEEKDYGEYRAEKAMDDMLANNVGPDEVIKSVTSKAKAIHLVVERPQDMNIAKFALRRFNEGGDGLVDRYVGIFRRLLMDIEDSPNRAPMK